MGDVPFFVDAVACETAADVIVYTTALHVQERVEGVVEGGLVVTNGSVMEKEVEVGRNGEFRRAVVAAPASVPKLPPPVYAIVEELGIGGTKGIRSAPGFRTLQGRHIHQLGLLHPSSELLGVFQHALGFLGSGL